MAVLSCAGILVTIRSPPVTGVTHDARGGFCFSARVWCSVVLQVVPIALVVGLRSPVPAPRRIEGAIDPHDLTDPGILFPIARNIRATGMTDQPGRS